MSAHGAYQKFITSKQEPLRLSLALAGFSRADISDEVRAAYCAYLRRRLRPALKQLVNQDDSLAMGRLSRVIGFTVDCVDDALALAVSEGRISAMVWLLRWKQENGGFCDRDFSL